jgi:hypothetical protein
MCEEQSELGSFATNSGGVFGDSLFKLNGIPIGFLSSIYKKLFLCYPKKLLLLVN